MKRILNLIATGAVLASTAIVTEAASKKVEKNEPKDRRAATAAVKAAGEDHFPEKMKIREIGSIKMDKTYYHVYCGELKQGGYHVIVFDNVPNYLGFYFTEYEPTDLEEDGILVTKDDDTREKIRVKEDSGPVDNTRIDGQLIKFIKAPEPEKKPVVVVEDGEEPVDSNKPEFREWTITHGAKKIKVTALYVSQTFGKVRLRGEASGKENDFPISSLSDEDKEYIKKFK